ncbi:MAG: gluconate transporter, partial [Bacteroidota bacterium]
MDLGILLPVLGGILLLLFLILKLKLQPFLALLISSITIGVATGMPFEDVLKNVQDGMAGTLGFVATIVGLGAIFGALLEKSGATESIASFLLNLSGIKNAPVALLAAGFFIAIPVFFDVAFVILVPMVYALQKSSGKSLLYFAIPLLAGLAITHAFIPPTPGPIAVADILNANLGLIIFYGFIVGLPTAIVSGILFGKYIGNKIHVEAPKDLEVNSTLTKGNKNSILVIFSVILIPLILILGNTLTSFLLKNNTLSASIYTDIISFIGHPFNALIVANILAIIYLG